VSHKLLTGNDGKETAIFLFRDAQIPRPTNFYLRWRPKHCSATPRPIHIAPRHHSAVYHIETAACLMPVDRRSCSTLSLYLATVVHCTVLLRSHHYFLLLRVSMFINTSTRSCNPSEVTRHSSRQGKQTDSAEHGARYLRY
jgi:hypothetical protein